VAVALTSGGGTASAESIERGGTDATPLTALIQCCAAAFDSAPIPSGIDFLYSFFSNFKNLCPNSDTNLDCFSDGRCGAVRWGGPVCSRLYGTPLASSSVRCLTFIERKRAKGATLWMNWRNCAKVRNDRAWSWSRLPSVWS